MTTSRGRRFLFGIAVLSICAVPFQSSWGAGQVDPNVWQPDVATARRVASQTNKLVLIHFYGQQCEPCRQVEANVYSQPDFFNAATNYFVFVKIDADASITARNEYGIDRIPTDVVTTPTGQVVTKYKTPLTVKGYLDQLTLVAAGTRTGGGALAAAAAAVKDSPLGGINGSTPWGANSPSASLPSYASDHPINSPAVTPPPGSAPSVPWASGGAPDYVAQRMQNASDAAQQRFGEGVNKLNGIQQSAAGAAQYGWDRGQAAVDGAKQAWTNGYQQFSSGAQQSATNLQQSMGNAATNGQQMLNAAATNAGNAVSTALPPWASGNTAAPAASSAPVANPFVPPAPSLPVVAPAPWLSANGQNSTNPPAATATPPAAANPSPGGTSGRVGGAYLAPSSPSGPAYAPPQPSTGPPPAATLRPATSSTTNPATSTPTAPAANPRPEIAAGNPPLGMEGYDTVRLIEQRKWTFGDRRWGVVHMGRTYLFSGVEEQQKFLANPNAYAPALSGNDVIAHFDEGKSISGQRKYGIFFNNRAYLFASQEALEKFKLNADRYAADVRQAELHAAGTIRR